MKKLLICAAALSGFALQASAADLGDITSSKDPIPDTLSWHGVTVYGTVDVGFGYTSNGNETSGFYYPGMNYNLVGNSLSQGAHSAITNSALSQSQIGVKVEENIGFGFTAIAKLDTGFNPISGELADACQSIIEVGDARAKNLIAGGNLNTFAVPSGVDGSRCGQAFNGQALAGVSSPLYGTLTFGRQNSLTLDAMANYDPMGLSYATSLIGYSGTAGAGIGSTETARWDNSVKYVFQYGPAHIAGAYASGSTDGTSIHGDAGAVDAGITYKGLSIDGVYTRETGAVSSLLGLLPGLTILPGTATPITSNTNQMYYYLTNNEAWSVMGKYTFEFGGGFKDEGPTSKLTFYGGFQQADLTNYNGQQGGTTIGGYHLAYLNNILLSTRTLDTAWAGAKYETGPWSFTAAYYWLHQDSFREANNILVSVGAAATPLTGGCSVNAGACAGDLNQVSFLVDYAFNKHFDTYAGISYQEVSGGLAHSFLSNDAFMANNNTTVVTGIRLKF
jgi:predicted porin